MKTLFYLFFILLAVSSITILNGCASSKQQVLSASESQVMLRSIQTRAFDTTDHKKMMKTIIATLQDLDFLIEKADLFLGTVTGTKYYRNSVVKISVSVRPRGKTQLLVRANAQDGIKAIEDPEPYQDFFNALSKSLFLTAHQVD